MTSTGGHAYELPEHGTGGELDAALAEAATQRQAAADAVVADMINWAGQAPNLDHYRQVYAATGTPWPGDDQIRQLYPVA